MPIPITRLYHLPDVLPQPDGQPELFEPIIYTDDLLIERIVSNGHTTAPDFWYEQPKDEWVLLLQGTATLLFDHNGGQQLTLQAGEAILIPAMKKHRVTATSQTPPCIWLAVHGQFGGLSCNQLPLFP